MADGKRVYYTCFLTPLISDDGTYAASATDISDRIQEADLGNLKKALDSADYDFGVFVYGSINLKASNEDGYLNESNDSRSIFKASRDKAKIEFKYNEIDENGTITSTVRFSGLINDEATRADIEKDEINFRVLSRDSVIRDTKVAAGLVTSGVTAKSALESILNVPAITSVLTFSAANINPDLNFTIDVGTEFDNVPVKTALEQIMIASNSVFRIDSSFNMIVSNRAEDTTKDVINLYGRYDIHSRENIGDIKGYNTGRHRMFTSIKVNNTEVSDAGAISDYGVRQKKFTFDFITDNDTERLIAQRMLDEFKVPKIEVQVDVPTDLVKNADLLDRVSINYPLRVAARAGNSLPIVGITQIGSTTEPLPDTYGSVCINPNTAFKIIEIKESTKKFFTTLKLRQTGTTQSDGVFDQPGSSIVGFAIIGDAVVAA